MTTARRKIRQKFQEQRAELAASKPINALSEKQAIYMDMIRTKQTVLALGLAGTGKTYIPTRMAAQAFLRGHIDKIILCRPAVSDSESLGFYKGTKDEKMMNWIMPMIDALLEDMDMGQIETAIKKGNIELAPFETIKGRSFNNAFVIVDEAEDITVAEAKKALTRVGKGSTMVLCGDITQKEGLIRESGLARAADMVDASAYLQSIADVIDFDEEEDIVRGEAAKRWVVAFGMEEGAIRQE